MGPAMWRVAGLAPNGRPGDLASALPLARPLALPVGHGPLPALLLIVIAVLLDDRARRGHRLHRIHLGGEMAPGVSVHQVLIPPMAREERSEEPRVGKE